MYNAPLASVLWFLPVLMLSVYTWGYFWPAYIRCSNVSVPAGSGRYNEVCHEDLIPYHHVAIKLANTFDGFYISHVSHHENTRANALAALTATLTLPADTSYHLRVASCHLFCLKYSLDFSEVYMTSTNFELETGDFLSSTIPCTTYYPIILKRLLSFEEELLASIMIR